LADGTINRADQSFLAFGNGAQTRLEGAGEKRIKAGVGGWVGFGGLAHVYAIAADKPFDNAVLERRVTVVVRQATSEAGNH